ncbi:MAG: hypothetical protein ACRELV_07760 [Longimicrobiales bacterium]
MGIALAALAACDGANLFEAGAGGSIGTGISIEITDPEDDVTAPIGLPLRVSAEVTAASGIANVTFTGVALRRDSLSNAVEFERFLPAAIDFPQPGVIDLPTDTLLVRELLPVDDATTEFVQIIATVTDSRQVVLADTVLVLLGGPDVNLLTPRDGDEATAGSALALSVEASDPTLGIDSVLIQVTGLVNQTFRWPDIGRIQEPVRRDTTVLLPDGVAGQLSVRGIAYSDTIPGRSDIATVTVTTAGPADAVAPTLFRTITSPARAELDDTIAVTVTARDVGSAGLVRIGVVARIADTQPAVPLLVLRDTLLATAATGSIVHTFVLHLTDFGLTELNLPLPKDVKVSVSAFAIDAAANCATAVAPEPSQSLPCVSAGTANGRTFFDAGTFAAPAPHLITVVLGTTILLPGGGQIADAVVDSLRQRLYLSNIDRNRVEVMTLADTSFQSSIAVGSRPWGLFIGGVDPATGVMTNDTLIIANSGGTNISFVGLDAAPDALLEDEPKRLLTPDVSLFEAQATVDETGAERFEVEPPIGFSDRPQFLAQDSLGHILFSTLPTGTAPDGTIRFVDTDPSGLTGDQPEVTLFTEYAAVVTEAGWFAFANVDGVFSATDASGAALTVVDHVPGFPQNQIVVTGNPKTGTLQAALDATQSDYVLLEDTRWSVAEIGLSDTTFVAASGDRGEIAFGEGNTAPGRIMVYRAVGQTISDDVEVNDLIGNASEVVNGIALNHNGSLGAARGSEGAYYFTGQDEFPGELRLQGVFQGDLGANGAGAALHPGHDQVTPSDETTLSFIGTEDMTVKIIDTFNFNEVGELAIRTSVTGPLRSSPPLPGDNAGLLPGDPNYVIARLYGVTADGGVVVVTVREKHVPGN